MPDQTETPADGKTGTESTTTETSQTTETTAAKPDAGKTFNQEELEAIVKDRVARAKPADYDEAKAALEAQRKRAEGEKSDLQKAQEERDREKARADQSDQTANAALRMSEIRIEALKQGADEELVSLALANDTTVEVKDGAVVGAKEAVEKLLERKPNLKTGGTRQSGGEFGGNDGNTVIEQVRKLREKGDKASLAEARRMEIAQQLGKTTS